jgi:CMP/dCMP kinase
VIITISGAAGSGKSTVARMVAKKLKLQHYSVGDFMRDLARKRGMTVLELSKTAEKDGSIDEELDDMQRDLGKFEDKFVLDARLGYHFVPDSFKVFLTVDLKEAARRIFGAGREGEKENATIRGTEENIRKRKASELKRYNEYYHLNPYDEKNYDVVIDTTALTPEDVVEKIVALVADG